jgi:hypothetical protein
VKQFARQINPVFLICCVLCEVFLKFSPFSVHGLDGISPAGKDGPAVLTSDETVYVPLILNNYPPASKGNLDVENLYISSLPADTVDHWTMDLLAGDSVTITVAPGNPVDILLTLLDSSGPLHQQNLSPTGEVETIVDLDIAKAGTYELLVQSVNGQATDYALLFLDQDSYSFVFRGTLQDGDTRTDSLPADVDYFWFFNGLAGQAASFTITPDGSGDPYIELYDPEGARILTLDDTAIGETESLENYMLLDSGLYSIRVAEFDFQEMDYQIALSIP